MADNQRPDGVDKRVAEDIAVPSQDPAGKENKEKTYDPKGKQVDGKKETKEEEMVSRLDSVRGDGSSQRAYHCMSLALSVASLLHLVVRRGHPAEERARDAGRATKSQYKTPISSSRS